LKKPTKQVDEFADLSMTARLYFVFFFNLWGSWRRAFCRRLKVGRPRVIHLPWPTTQISKWIMRLGRCRERSSPQSQDLKPEPDSQLVRDSRGMWEYEGRDGGP